MKHSLCITAIMALSSYSGLAVAGTNSTSQGQFPDGIAHPNEFLVQEIASRMFMLMPEGDQVKIAQANGIGSEDFDLSSFTHRDDATPASDIPADITADEYLKLIVSDELSSRMTAEQWNILNTIASTIDDGKLVPQMCFSPETDREYAFAINQLIEFPLQSRFQQTNRWTSTATDGGGLSQGTPITLTYSFVPDGTLVSNLGTGLGSGNSQLFSWLNGIYGNEAAWQSLFAQVFDRWAELTGLSYIYEPNDDGVDTNSLAGQIGVRGDVRIAAFNFQNDGNGGVLAYNNFPQDGDMVFDAFDSFYNSTFSNSLRFRNVAAHEHGHGLGMLHVCPVTQTKLMEPFVSTSFNGPQLDDILNGIRHYGDFAEPNDSIPDATDMGSFSVGDADSLNNLGIDDNSDRDIFLVTVTERARVLFSVTPDAGEYEQGQQTSQCDTGALTDYNSIQNLEITVTLSNGLPIQSENSTGTGDLETIVIDIETPGDYYFVVEGATNINNVQRYRTGIVLIDIPFLVPTIDANAPARLDPGVTNTFDVTINPREDVIEAGSELLFYSVNSDSFESTPLVNNGGTQYTASIPAVNCDDSVEFYLSIQAETGGEITFPADGDSNPFSAFVGEFVTVFDDDFQADLGWAVSGDITARASGIWERGAPRGDGSRGDAPEDADGSGSCYLTGNGNAGSNTDVDGGQTILTSPVFDVSQNPDASISYSRWFHNSFGANPNVEIFQVEISNNNGSSWTDLETVAGNSSESNGGWFQKSFRIADFVSTTSQVRIRFIAEDISGAVVEAAVDGIKINGQACEDVQICPADLTGDGVLDFFDVSEFLDLFAQGDPRADFTSDGTFDFFDVSDFLDAFAAGCP